MIQAIKIGTLELLTDTNSLEDLKELPLGE